MSERMTDEQIEAVIASSKNDDCWCHDYPPEGNRLCMPCQTRETLIQLRTDLAATREKLRVAVEEAYHEGYSEGYGHGLSDGHTPSGIKAYGPSSGWEHSDAKAALAQIKDGE